MRCIKRRVRPMLAFKSPTSAAIILSGIEMARSLPLDTDGHLPLRGDQA